MAPNNKISITFIVNGVDIPIEANIHQPLKVARDKALKDSNNTGRPVDEWEVHNDKGEALDSSQKIADLGLKDGDRLFLTLKVGAGGSK